MSKSVIVDSTPFKTAEKTVIAIPVDSRYMFVGDTPIEIDPRRNTTAQIRSNRVFLPMRALVELMGGSLCWDQTNKTVTAELNGYTMMMQVGNTRINTNGSTTYLDTVPYIENDRVMLPLRGFETLFELRWEGGPRIVYVNSKN